jgi:coenzyme PQQ precursor peptide PqqA
MTFLPEKNDDTKQTIREREVSAEPVEPRPWTAPDFVERSTCAEIGAYAFQDK